MNLKNMEIRESAKESGLYLWQIAEIYGIHDSNFSRLLRQELPPETKAKILQIIEELKRNSSLCASIGTRKGGCASV